MGLEPYTETTQAQILDIRAAHNLITRDSYVWDVATGLIPLAETYAGKPLIINHDWWDVSQSKGRILSAKVQEKSPADIPNEIKVLAKQDPQKQKIMDDVLAKYGYWELNVQAWIDAESPAVRLINQGSYSEVSFGALGGNSDYCPNSGKEMHPDYESDNYFQVRCEHSACRNCLVDFYGWGLAESGYFSQDELKKYPVIYYYITGDIVEAIELSFVMIPNLVGAKMVA